ncbi:MAG: hypothetical protein PHF65_05855 [Oscillospiraceae bacterium]|nr:hypothetical protein [Oscillospiraceae bacterium]
MAFMSILIMMLVFMGGIIFLVGGLTLGGTILLVVGLTKRSRNKKSGKKSVAPIVCIVIGGILLIPVVFIFGLYIYLSLVQMGIAPGSAVAIFV